MAYIGAEPVPGQNREVDDISSGFNGSATAFTLQVSSTNVSPESANNILVNLGGVMQNPGTDYTIAASTITFTTAPASGLSFWALILGAGINTATVADQTIGPSKLLNTAVTAGSYTTADITIDAQGRITAAANGTIAQAEIANDAIGADQLASNSVVSASIVDGSIVNADINASAAIAKSKLASLDIVNADVNASAAIAGSKLADDSISLAKLEHGTSSNNGKFLRANNGADPTFETVTGTTINNNANNRVITGSGTANTLEGESGLTFDSSNNVLTAGGGLGIQNVSGVIAGSGGGNDYLTIRDSSNTDRLVVRTHGTNNGKVGIGTNNPDDTLDVVGTFQVSSNSYQSNIYLSGSLFLGGTGSANELDDFEEGTWTPTVSSGTVGQASTARYTKIGQVVHLQFGLYQFSDNTSSTDINIGGIPFTASDQAVGTWAAQRVDTDGLGTFCTIYGGGSTIQLLLNTGDTTGNVMGTVCKHNRLAQTLAYQFMSLTYRTAS